MTPTQRRALANGIHTCRNCGTQIDSDPLTYTVEQLVRWRAQAEARAEERLGKRGEFLEAEARDAAIAASYWGAPARFLALLRMTPSAMTSGQILTADVRHAFALDDPGPWKTAWIKTFLQGRDLKVLVALEESPAIRTRA